MPSLCVQMDGESSDMQLAYVWQIRDVTRLEALYLLVVSHAFPGVLWARLQIVIEQTVYRSLDAAANFVGFEDPRPRIQQRHHRRVTITLIHGHRWQRLVTG